MTVVMPFFTSQNIKFEIAVRIVLTSISERHYKMIKKIWNIITWPLRKLLKWYVSNPAFQAGYRAGAGARSAMKDAKAKKQCAK